MSCDPLKLQSSIPFEDIRAERHRPEKEEKQCVFLFIYLFWMHKYQEQGERN